MGRVLIACAGADAGMAARVARALADAGCEAETRQRAPSLKPDKEVFDAAPTLIVLWSRHMTGETAMLREAAAAGDRLVIARLDATRLPPPLRAARTVALSAARPQAGLKALQGLATGVPARKPPRNAPSKPAAAAKGERDERSTWRGTLLITLVVGALAWTAYYVVVGEPVDLRAVIAASPV